MSATRRSARDAQSTHNTRSKGTDFYKIGTIQASNGNWIPGSVGTRQGFKDEWEFHNVLNKRTSAFRATVTDEQFDEYARRRGEVSNLQAPIYGETRCLLSALRGKPCNMPDALGHEEPGDRSLWEGDPFTSLSIFSHVDPLKALNIQFGKLSPQAAFQLPTNGREVRVSCSRALEVRR